MAYSDSFHDTGSTSLVSHVPTKISDNSSEAGLSYAAAESISGGGMNILGGGIGARVTSSTGHVLSNVSTPTSTFVDTTTFTYKTGGSQDSNVGSTAFDNGGTGGGLTCYSVRINLSTGSLTPTVQIVRIVSGSGSAPATYGLSLSNNDVVACVTTYTISSNVDFSIDIKVNGSSVHTLTYTDTSPISASGTFLGFRGDGVNNDTTGMLLFSRDTPSAGPSDPFITVSPSTSATGGGNITYTLTGSNTAWTGGTTATISGGTGASIVSQGISGQVITAVVNIGTAAGTLTFGNSSDAGTGTTAVTLGLPGTPTSLSGTPGNGQVALTWTAPASGGTVATYNLYRGTTSNGESSTPIATGIASTSYTDSSAINNTAYYYKVKAVNATGTSSYSTEAGPYTPTAPLLTLIAAAKAVLDSGTVSLTATVTSGNGSPLSVTVSGGGTLSTAVPTSGIPFTYTAPSLGTGTATITLTGGGVGGSSVKTIFYGPDSDWVESYLKGSTGGTVLCQVYDLSGATVGPLYGPLSVLAGSGAKEYGTIVILPSITNTYRAIFSDGNGGNEVYLIQSTPKANLKSTGLDNISATSPTVVATTFRQKVLQVWDRHFGKAVKNDNDDTIKVMQGSGSTPATTQTYSVSSGVATVNLSS